MGEMIDIKRLLSELVSQNIAIGQRIDMTNQRIDETGKCIDETGKRIDAAIEAMRHDSAEANKRIDETGKRIDETGKRIDATMKLMHEQRIEADKHHREAVELFYILREALERLPDAIKETIGFEIATTGK